MENLWRGAHHVELKVFIYLCSGFSLDPAHKHTRDPTKIPVPTFPRRGRQQDTGLWLSAAPAQPKQRPRMPVSVIEILQIACITSVWSQS